LLLDKIESLITLFSNNFSNGGTMAKDKVDLYKDNQGEWRWRQTAPNGKVVGGSTQGYKNKQDCIENANRNGVKIPETPKKSK